MAPIVNGLLKSVGLQQTFIYMGMAVFVVIVGLSFFLPTPPKIAAPGVSGSGECNRRGGLLQIQEHHHPGAIAQDL